MATSYEIALIKSGFFACLEAVVKEKSLPVDVLKKMTEKADEISSELAESITK